MALPRCYFFLMAGIGCTYLVAFTYWHQSSSYQWSIQQKTSQDGRNNSLSSSSCSSSSSPPEWIESYIQWHREQLHSNVSNYSYFVYKCVRYNTCGGIGDRLNGMVQSFYMALCNDRVFLIDYSSPYPLSTTLQPNRLFWNVSTPQSDHHVETLFLNNDRTHPVMREPAELSRNETFRYAQGIHFKSSQWMDETLASSACLRDFIQRYAAINQRSDASHHPECSFTTARSTFNGSFGVIINPNDLFRWAFQTLFQVSKPLQERVQQIQQQAGLFTECVNCSEHDIKTTTATTDNHSESSATSAMVLKPYVAMHVRTGKGTNFKDPVRHWGNETFLNFLQCAKRLQHELARTIVPPTTFATTTTTETTTAIPLNSYSSPLIYVASDNVATKQLFEEWDTSIRFDHRLNVVHADRTRNPPLQSYLDAWAELVVLWQAHALVMSHSTFSQKAEVVGQFSNRTARYFDQCEDG